MFRVMEFKQGRGWGESKVLSPVGGALLAVKKGLADYVSLYHPENELPGELKGQGRELKTIRLEKIPLGDFEEWVPAMEGEEGWRASVVGVGFEKGNLFGHRLIGPACARKMTGERRSEDLFKSLRGTVGPAKPWLHPFLIPTGMMPCSFDCVACEEFVKSLYEGDSSVSKWAEFFQEAQTVIWASGRMAVFENSGDQIPVLTLMNYFDNWEEYWKGFFDGQSWPSQRIAFPSQPLIYEWGKQSLFQRPFKTVFLEMNKGGGDFFAPESMALPAGWLKNIGVETKRINISLSDDYKEMNPDWTRKLARELKKENPDLVVFHDVLAPELFNELKMEDMTTVLVGGRPAKAEGGLSFTRTGGLPLGLLDLVKELREEVVVPESDSHLNESAPDLRFFTRWFQPEVDEINLNGFPHSESRRVTILQSPFCSYVKNFSENESFEGINFPEGVNKTGCSFCGIAQFPEKLPKPKEFLELQAHQIKLISRLSSCRDFVVYPPIKQLPELLQRLKKIKGLTLWLHFRVNEFLKSDLSLRKALEIAKINQQKIVNHLIGFENFSDEELKLFNKGITAKDISFCLTQLEELRKDFPEQFDYRSQSHGFILFNPWTKLDDLSANIEFAKNHELSWMRSTMAESRLRLAPHIPLFYKAKKEGLLLGAESSPKGMIFGYAGEYFDYRFKDPQTQKVWELMVAFSPMAKGRVAWQFSLLDCAVQYVKGLDVADEALPIQGLLDQFQTQHQELFQESSGKVNLVREVLPLRDYGDKYFKKLGRFRLEGVRAAQAGLIFQFEHERASNRVGLKGFDLKVQLKNSQNDAGFHDFASTRSYALLHSDLGNMAEEASVVLDFVFQAVDFLEKSTADPSEMEKAQKS